MEVSLGSTCFNSSPTVTKQKKVIRNTDNSHTDPGLSLIFVGPRAKAQVEDYNPPRLLCPLSPLVLTARSFSHVDARNTLLLFINAPPHPLLNNLPLAIWHGGHGLPRRGYSENGAHVGPRGGPRTFKK